jgi:hypothetical protein
MADRPAALHEARTVHPEWVGDVPCPRTQSDTPPALCNSPHSHCCLAPHGRDSTVLRRAAGKYFASCKPAGSAAASGAACSAAGSVHAAPAVARPAGARHRRLVGLEGKLQQMATSHCTSAMCVSTGSFGQTRHQHERVHCWCPQRFASQSVSAMARQQHAMLLLPRRQCAQRPLAHLVVVAQLLPRRDRALGEDADVVGAVHLEAGSRQL